MLLLFCQPHLTFVLCFIGSRYLEIQPDQKVLLSHRLIGFDSFMKEMLTSQSQVNLIQWREKSERYVCHKITPFCLHIKTHLVQAMPTYFPYLRVRLERVLPSRALICMMV